MTPTEHFKTTAPKWMHLFLKDFPKLTKLDAAAVFGNAGYESKGLTDDQEDKPVVKGSRGGANWMQWTGSRRKALEAYAKRNNYDPNSDEVAYKWLFIELKTTKQAAIPALLGAKTLEDKVVAFEKAFLHAGVKNYDKRVDWAKLALQSYEDWLRDTPSNIEKPRTDHPTPPSVEPKRKAWWEKSVWEILRGK